MTYKDKLPDSFVLSSVQKEEDARLRELQHTAQKGYRELIKMKDLVLPESLKEITPEWLAETVKGKLESIAKIDYLPTDECERIAKQWQMVQNFGLRAIRDIQALISDVGFENITFDKGLQTFFITDIAALATLRATREVPALAKEYWRQVTHILREIEELRRYEDEKEIIPQSLVRLASISVNDFLAIWCSGTATVNHQFDHLPNMYHLKNSDYNNLVL